jgi:O-antigen ligase
VESRHEASSERGDPALRLRGPARIIVSPWAATVVVLAGVTIGMSRAPLALGATLAVVSVVAVLVWRFGLREGLWYFLMAAIPLRAALSFDILQTTSLFFGDGLALALLIDTAYRRGFVDVWRRSHAFKLGVAIIALSLLGLYTATRAYWGFVSVFVIMVGVSLLFVARDIVRTPEQARRTLYALLLGLVVPIAYGLYQSTLPYGAELPEWSAVFTAYSQDREPQLRVFSTFAHPLRFSHYLSIGFSIAVGLIAGRATAFRRLALLFLAGLAAAANYFTYSIGGVGTMLVGGAAAVMTALRRRGAFLAVLIVIPLSLMFLSGALAARVEHLLSGESSSFAARVVTYRQALNVIRDHPLTGVSWGGIRSSLEGRYRLTRSVVVAKVAENYFLHRGMALGVPGIVLYAALMALFIRNVLRARDGPGDAWPRAAILAGGAAFYVQAQVMPTTDGSVTYLLWILIALSEGMFEATGQGGEVLA